MITYRIINRKDIGLSEVVSISNSLCVYKKCNVSVIDTIETCLLLFNNEQESAL